MVSYFDSENIDFSALYFGQSYKSFDKKYKIRGYKLAEGKINIRLLKNTYCNGYMEVATFTNVSRYDLGTCIDRINEAIVDIEAHGVDPDSRKASAVNHPSHYSGKIECIEAMESAFSKEEVKAFCKLNAFKYIWRACKKGGEQDIDKAAWYLNRYLSYNESKKED